MRKKIDEGRQPNGPFRASLVGKLNMFTSRKEHVVAHKSMLYPKGIEVTSITEHADDTPTRKLREAIIESIDKF